MSYTIISQNLLLDNNISDQSKILYFTLNSLAEDLNHIRISEKELAKVRDVSDRTIRNSLKELAEYGLIAKYRNKIKDIQTYIIIPYEIREVVEIANEEALNSLLERVYEFIDKEINIEKKDKLTQKVAEQMDKEYTARDYCKYFSDKALEKKGIVINYCNTKAISIMKRITKNKSVEENLRLIDTFLDIYDYKFKRQGFEYPTIASFGASWIYNLVVEFEKNRPREVREEEILDILF